MHNGQPNQGKAISSAPDETPAQGAGSNAATYQGKPCASGHDGRRYVSNRQCVTCALAGRAASYDRAKAAKAKAAYRARRKAMALAGAMLESFGMA